MGVCVSVWEVWVFVCGGGGALGGPWTPQAMTRMLRRPPPSHNQDIRMNHTQHCDILTQSHPAQPHEHPNPRYHAQPSAIHKALTIRLTCRPTSSSSAPRPPAPPGPPCPRAVRVWGTWLPLLPEGPFLAPRLLRGCPDARAAGVDGMLSVMIVDYPARTLSERLLGRGHRNRSPAGPRRPIPCCRARRNHGRSSGAERYQRLSAAVLSVRQGGEVLVAGRAGRARHAQGKGQQEGQQAPG